MSSNVLAEAARLYLGQAKRLSYGDVRASQHPPFSSLTFGAAGIAYVYWRAAQRGPARQAHLTEARRWADAVEQAGLTRDGYVTPHYASTLAVRERSLATGPDGLGLVRALIAFDLGEQRFARELDAFERRARAHARRPDEFLLGTAGYLLAARSLAKHTGSARASALAAALAGRLLVAPRPGRPHWTRLRNLGFARGQAGIFHAVLELAGDSGAAVPGWFLGALERLASRLERPPPGASPWLRRSFCNGASGHVLLWTAAARATGAPAHARLAERSAQLAADRARVGPTDVCCGLGGRAYACLAMEQRSPGQGWKTAAIELATEAIGRFESPWQHGLLRGWPGLVCLALDLTRPSALGVPLVQA